MTGFFDLNSADKQSTFGEIIPKGAIVKIRLWIKPGGHNDPTLGLTDDLATLSEKTGSIYLAPEYTIIGGEYDKRKIFKSLIGIVSPKGPTWGNMGRSFMRAVLESARGIAPDDMSDRAIAARQINSLADLQGVEFVAKVNVEPGADGFGDANTISGGDVITPNDKRYAAAMALQGAASNGAGHAPQPKAVTTPKFGAGSTGGGKPDWMA